MYKDSEKEIKITKKYRTFYCNCCGTEIGTMIESSSSPVRFISEQITDKSPMHTIWLNPDDRSSWKIEGDFCNECWNKLNNELFEFLTTLCDRYSRAGKLINH